jgi:hypothetical protein
MTDSHPPLTRLSGTPLAFDPVPQIRRRSNGWTPEQQERFILALQEVGSVGLAASAVGMNRVSAYRLRERAGAEGFAAAWDRAIQDGQARVYDVAMERAINGVTTISIRRGGAVDITGGADMRMVYGVLKPAPAPVRATS